jgi:hypothetical protein
MNNTLREDRASRVRIAPRQAVSVDLETGDAIHCASGVIWMTQEGDARDHCVPAGVSFCADRKGQAVLSAVDGTSDVIVRRGTPNGGCIPGTLRIDSIERLTHAARNAQASAIAAAAARVSAWILSWVRRARAA